MTDTLEKSIIDCAAYLIAINETNKLLNILIYYQVLVHHINVVIICSSRGGAARRSRKRTE